MLAIADVLAFPLLSYYADRQPGLLQQMRAIVQRYTTTPTFTGEARTLAGYVTRIAAGMAVWRSRLAKQITTYGSARWAEREEIAKAGLTRPAGVFLGKTTRTPTTCATKVRST